jgi:glycosidase
MPWTAGKHGGFTTGEPWLPVGDPRRNNVANQLEDPRSLLHRTRELIVLKKRLDGEYEALAAPSCCWRYRRGRSLVELDFERSTASVREGEPRSTYA